MVTRRPPGGLGAELERRALRQLAGPASDVSFEAPLGPQRGDGRRAAAVGPQEGGVVLGSELVDGRRAACSGDVDAEVRKQRGGLTATECFEPRVVELDQEEVPEEPRSAGEGEGPRRRRRGSLT